MIVVDTSVWANHINREIKPLSDLIQAEEVLVHPFVIGELAMGNLNRREAVLRDLHKLPGPILATEQEVLRLVAQHRLFGRGIGYIDAHLLAATRLTADATLWSLDQRLVAAALQLKIARLG